MPNDVWVFDGNCLEDSLLGSNVFIKNPANDKLTIVTDGDIEWVCIQKGTVLGGAW